LAGVVDATAGHHAHGGPDWGRDVDAVVHRHRAPLGMGLGTEAPDDAAAHGPLEPALAAGEIAGVGLRAAALRARLVRFGAPALLQARQQLLDRAGRALQLGGGGFERLAPRLDRVHRRGLLLPELGEPAVLTVRLL